MGAAAEPQEQVKAFELAGRDPASRARAGVLRTRHGEIPTPAFFPVATQGAVKALSQEDLESLGVRGLLANTYHLYLRPGLDILKRSGGLHRFMNYPGAILTDSGGYQIFSLSHLRKVEPEGVLFKSHHDGTLHRLTPERVIEIQAALGSDLWTCLDVCPPYPCGREEARRALQLTQAWADRSWAAYGKLGEDPDGPAAGSGLFGILQGSVYPDLRREAADHLLGRPFGGFALGGLSVGEPKEETWKVLDLVEPLLPADRPRYLMGVGTPEDLWEAVERGMDIFDCVWPTRNARNGQVMTGLGKLYIKNAPCRDDPRPLDPDCSCPVCGRYSRAYLSHLFRSRELSSHRLLSIHNLHFLLRLMETIRASIQDGTFPSAKRKFLADYTQSKET